MSERSRPVKPKAAAVRRHLRQHSRFYAGTVAAVIAFLIVPGETPEIRVLAGADAFYATYLVLLTIFASQSDADDTKRHARVEDEGLPLIAALTASAVAVSLASIFIMLRSDVPVSAFALTVALVSLPLGWLTMHASFALHYARLYYADTGAGQSRQGFEFPCDEEPDVWDFMYLSFAIATSMAMSDVQVTRRGIRRFVLGHSILSFFYSTVIVALMVNAAAGK